MKNDTLNIQPDLIDPFQRRLSYLRVSITDRCNLNCLYCTPNRLRPKLAHADILRYEEILRLVRLMTGLGISKVRVTGGEPLIRKGVIDFLKKLVQIPGLTDVALTTNGILLENMLPGLAAAGVKRLNISLDSLETRRFAHITGHNDFERVRRGIFQAHAMGFHPIKINAVVLKGVNDDQIRPLAELSRVYPFAVRFIEYMPIGIAAISSELTGQQMLTHEIRRRVEGLGPLLPIAHEAADGPAERFRFQDAPGEVGFISPISHHFCQTCNRLRLTANGSLRTCLLCDSRFDLKTPLRQGADDATMTRLILEAVRNKPRRHPLGLNPAARFPGQMSQIGG
jgi:GTP 3',8-cyclase